MNLIPYELVRIFAWVFLVLFLFYGFYSYYKKTHPRKIFHISFSFLVIAILFFVAVFLGRSTTGHPSVYFFGETQGPFEHGPELPILSAIKFFMNARKFERVSEIGFDPSNLPSPLNRNYSTEVTLDLVAKEVLGELSNGTTFNYWTFNGQVPGPMVRVRVGDTITVNLKNDMSSIHTHSVDFHATTGPGGGAKFLQVLPGETKSLTWKALAPGAYIYHCASKDSVGAHNAHGQYGLIVVEPLEGYPEVDKEFYVVQGEFYTRGKVGDKGLVAFDSLAMLDENPNYIVFNGRVDSLNNRMQAEVGDKVRIFFGNGGVAKISSFHVIGEIFDTVYHEGGDLQNHNVQTTVVPAGGSTIVEFTLDVPGSYILVDHSLARMDKGAWGIMQVTGEENKSIFNPKN